MPISAMFSGLTISQAPMSYKISVQQIEHQNFALCARHARHELVAGLLFGVGEENIAMIGLSLQQAC